MLDHLRGDFGLDANTGVGKDRAMPNADEVSAGESRFVAGDFDVSHHRRHKIKNAPRSTVNLSSPGSTPRKRQGDHGPVTETEIIEYVSGQPGVVTVTASKENSAPESAWGDTFFFYDPERNRPENQRLPFATVVVHDYVGWDTESHLDRDGIFRVNIAVGRSGFEQLLGYPPAQHQAHHEEFDYAATDVFIPHPTYASEGWVSVLNPAERTSVQVRQLLDDAHALAVRRHERRLDARQT